MAIFYYKYKLVIYSILVFICVSVVYNIKSTPSFCGDSLPNKYLPISIIKNHNFQLDPFLEFSNRYYYLRKVNGHNYSLYPLGTSILVLPVYLTADLLHVDLIKNVDTIEKISVTLLICISCIFVFLSCELITNNSLLSLLMVFVYAFGTSSWSISSQTMFQQPANQLVNSIILFLLLKRNYSSFMLGLFAGFGIFIRPTNIIILIILCIYIFFNNRNNSMRRLLFIAGSSIFILVTVIYNITVFNDFFGGYKSLTVEFTFNEFFTRFFGLLISPNRGLLIFSPVLIFSIINLFVIKNEQYKPVYILLYTVTCCYLIFYSTYPNWFGGWSFGYRFLLDIMPFLVILLVPVVLKYIRKLIFLIFFMILLLYSVFVQIGGVFFDDGEWNVYPNIEFNQDRIWDWDDWVIPDVLGITSRKYSVRALRDVQIPAGNNKFKQVKGFGFSYPEDWGVWAVGKESVIIFNSTKKQVKLNMSATSFTKIGKSQYIEIFLNKQFVKKLCFTKPYWEFERFNVILNTNTGKQNELMLKYRFFKRPEYPDIRKISVAFKYIYFS